MSSFPSAQLDAALSALPSSVSAAQSKVIDFALVPVGDSAQYAAWAAAELLNRKGKCKAHGDRILALSDAALHVWAPERQGTTTGRLEKSLHLLDLVGILSPDNRHVQITIAPGTLAGSRRLPFLAIATICFLSQMYLYCAGDWCLKTA